MALPQGDLGLLDTDVAQRMLTSTVPARLAYCWSDGTPRVLPIWFHWDGTDMVMASTVAAPKLKALSKRPEVAITIDSNDYPHDVLLVRGTASITEVDGVVPEYAAAARRYLGEEGGAGFVAQMNLPGLRMARIAVRPTWVGTLDFQTRLPSAIGGVIG